MDRDRIEKIIDETVRDTQYVYSEKAKLAKEISEYFREQFKYLLNAEDKTTCPKCSGSLESWGHCDCKKPSEPRMMQGNKTMFCCKDHTVEHTYNSTCDIEPKCIPVEDAIKEDPTKIDHFCGMGGDSACGCGAQAVEDATCPKCGSKSIALEEGKPELQECTNCFFCFSYNNRKQAKENVKDEGEIAPYDQNEDFTVNFDRLVKEVNELKRKVNNKERK